MITETDRAMFEQAVSDVADNTITADEASSTVLATIAGRIEARKMIVEKMLRTQQNVLSGREIEKLAGASLRSLTGFEGAM